MKKLKLYSRIECPLCEYAEELLLEGGITYETIDIDESEQLIRQYHVRIPVLANESDELNWPFTIEQAQGLLQERDHG